MTLTEQLQQDMKSALKGGDKLALGTLRMALAAIKRREIDDRGTLDDAAVIAVIEKLVKQGRDSEQQYRAAGRAELADKEAAEIEVLERYLPQPLSAAELDALIRATVESTGAASVKDMGRVMGEIKQQAAGRADMGTVSKRVRDILAGG
ncbi:MAG: GatB/YqeY domain-containing protein [Gammaproteobacteria bacterium]|nr:GatB/YqeY domain-containing protein [Gammaproteobacteria bacterium]